MALGNSIIIDYKTGLEPALAINYTFGNGKPQMDMIKMSVMPTVPMSWWFGKINPFREAIDPIIIRCIETGLITHWKRATMNRMKAKSVSPVDESQTKHLKKFSLENVKGAFFFWSGMILIAFMVFIIETLV